MRIVPAGPRPVAKRLTDLERGTLFYFGDADESALCMVIDCLQSRSHQRRYVNLQDGWLSSIDEFIRDCEKRVTVVADAELHIKF